MSTDKLFQFRVGQAVGVVTTDSTTHHSNPAEEAQITWVAEHPSGHDLILEVVTKKNRLIRISSVYGALKEGILYLDETVEGLAPCWSIDATGWGESESLHTLCDGSNAEENAFFSVLRGEKKTIALPGPMYQGQEFRANDGGHVHHGRIAWVAKVGSKDLAFCAKCNYFVRLGDGKRIPWAEEFEVYSVRTELSEGGLYWRHRDEGEGYWELDLREKVGG